MATTAREQIAEIATDVKWIRERQDDSYERLERLEQSVAQHNEARDRAQSAQIKLCESRFAEIDKAVIVNKTKLGLLVAGGVIVIQAVISIATAIVKQAFFEGR